MLLPATPTGVLEPLQVECRASKFCGVSEAFLAWARQSCDACALSRSARCCYKTLSFRLETRQAALPDKPSRRSPAGSSLVELDLKVREWWRQLRRRRGSLIRVKAIDLPQHVLKARTVKLGSLQAARKWWLCSCCAKLSLHQRLQRFAFRRISYWSSWYTTAIRLLSLEMLSRNMQYD